MPAITGPATRATFDSRWRSALARCSSSSGTVSGSSPAHAGWWNASAAPPTVASTASCQTCAWPEISSTPIAPCPAAEMTSAATITRIRGRRSAQTPPASSSTATGTSSAPSTMPSAVGESVSSSTAKASAIGVIHDPSSDTACAANSSL